jgi:hypothetical protein
LAIYTVFEIILIFFFSVVKSSADFLGMSTADFRGDFEDLLDLALFG